MPKTVWRPNPFEKPLNKFDNAEWQRTRIIELMKKENRPMTMKEIAQKLDIGGKGYYGKARRYAMVVADPTHEIHRGKRRADIGWTLKDEYK
jgi:repressor of nif and glnA expression